MHIQRLRVENFRKLVAPLEIVGLPPGMAVIGGDNEEGKSTLLQALRSAFFDRHGLSGQAAAAMQPLGHKVAPEIEVDFHLGGHDYRLKKRFCLKPAARLEGPGRVLEDEAAEDALQELLGFERPGRGASDTPHHGLWGLLWVSQGTTFAPVAPSEGARHALGEVLEEDVGEVLGGAVGQQLLKHFGDWRDRYWGRSGKPVQELKKAAEASQERADALAMVREQLARYDDQLLQLERTTRELEGFQEEQRLAEMQRRLAAAEDRARELDRLQQALREAETRLETTALHLREAEGRWDARQALEAEAREARANAAELARREEAMAAELHTLETTLAEIGAALDGARKRRDEARGEERRRGLLVQRRELEEERRRLAEQRERAAEARQAAAAARREAASIVVDAGTLAALREAEQAVSRAGERLSAAATEVTVDVAVPFRLRGDAVPLEKGYRVTGQAGLELEGVGYIGIRAGGSDLPALEQALAQARELRAGLLETLGVADLYTAEGELARKAELRNTVAYQERLVAVHAPEGVEALESRLADVMAALEGLPAVMEDPDGGLDDLRRAREAARLALEEAEQAAAAAEGRHGEQARRVQGVRDELTGIRGRLRELNAQAERADKRLAGERGQVADAELARRVTEQRAARDAAGEALEQARGAVAALDPGAVQRGLEDARRAVEETEKQLRELEGRQGQLRAALRALGQQGLAEQAAELERQAAEAERRHRALEREATAVRLVAEALEEAALNAREVYLQPLLGHLQPYLDAVFPGARPVMGDALEMAGLARDYEEGFEQLSIGAREQLAILTRLAFADLLAEEGESPPVILDDALVYADETRFETMKALLSRSARRHQVLILTCRPREYLSLGAAQFRLY
ncbi:MAG: AAA family ATPase [Gammaproteobacteria bacterium]|nr:AAA family ATPase [Gammaproteobacteria bacterium]